MAKRKATEKAMKRKATKKKAKKRVTKRNAPKKKVKRKTKKAERREDLIFQSQLVVFLDMLGFQDRVRQLHGVPGTPEEKENLFKVLRSTLGPMVELRESFRALFSHYAERGSELHDVPAGDREVFLRLRSVDVGVYGMSDATVLTIPLMTTEERPTPMTSIWVALGAVAGLTVVSLSTGVPLRGGMDVGFGTQLRTGEPFGTGLVRAYDLESHLAEYPRILAGSELIHYLRSAKQLEPGTPENNWTIHMAGLCERMIARDLDGRWFLDYLGEEVHGTYSGEIEPETVQKAFSYAKRQLQQFQETGNAKLAARYYRLCVYFEAHKELWDIDIGAPPIN